MSIKVLNIWLGSFASKAKLNAFLKESYGGKDSKPISAFAASQNRTFYDHDWLESYYRNKDQTSLIDEHVPSTYLFAVREIVKSRKIENANAIILFFGEWSKPVKKTTDPELWHLGQFDAEYLKKISAAYTPGTIPNEFWTDFPQKSVTLAVLKKEAKKDSASMVKLGIMALCGIGMKENPKLKTSQFVNANAPVEMKIEALTAVAELNYANAWMELYTLSVNEAENIVSDDERRRFIETAARLGSDEAKNTLAGMLMYSWTSKLYKVDYGRAEELLLSQSELTRSVQLHQLYCLYNMMEDHENALIWKKRDADTYGSSASTRTVADIYISGLGVEKNAIETAKYLYLQFCQTPANKLEFRESDTENLDNLSVAELKEGRRLAKEWIASVGNDVAANRGKLAHFEGEKNDPFQTYLKDRCVFWRS